MSPSLTLAHSPPRQELETGAAAGTLTQGMDGPRRPLIKALEPTPRPDAPPQVVPPRFICRHCGKTDSEAFMLCDPVRLS